MARSTEFVPDNEVDPHWTIFRAPIITGIKGHASLLKTKNVIIRGERDRWFI